MPRKFLIDNAGERLVKLETKVEDISTDLKELAVDVRLMNDKMDKLTQRADTSWTSYATQAEAKFATKDELGGIAAQVRHLSDNLNKQDNRIYDLVKQGAPWVLLAGLLLTFVLKGGF